ncbi:MAG TPA: cytochrome c [Geminicoccaceae bacterium]|jgi:mono/diheme cytochrome c family protein|nr:cytochrome c [Geminicoccaceae bacterium]
MRRAPLAIAVVLVGASAAGVAWLSFGQGGSSGPTLRQLENGEEIYAANCAACHGVNLEGEPGWQSRLPSDRLPAPPHDASGHTWHHPDGVLFRITKEGPAAVVGGNYESDMPSFGDVLSDDEIWAVLTFIKSRWPERERQLQAEMSRKEKEADQ